MVCAQCKAQVTKIGQFCPQCGAKFKPQFDYRVYLIWGGVIGAMWAWTLFKHFAR